MVDADNGTLISELKIGDNINSTPAILDGRIYIGAFNGKLHCLGMEPKTSEVRPEVRGQRSDVRRQTSEISHPTSGQKESTSEARDEVTPTV